MSCEDMSSVTFSPASADGPTPWPLPNGRLIDPSGLAAALASLSARQVAAMGLRTSGISGRLGSTSSASADLSQYLANRLQAQLATGGSILYRQTWKQKATPSGALYWAHTASAHRTSDSDCTGWPTPVVRDQEQRRRWDKSTRPSENSASGRLADADVRDAGAEGLQRGGEHGQRPRHGGAGDGRSTSPLHGYWRDADWLRCRDGKWRPVEPGTFPLAHGVSSRVGRLRAYGNAIVPQVAAEFVRAAM